MGAYYASKVAQVSGSHCVGLELAKSGVRCNLVSSGSTDTPMLRAMLGGEVCGENGFARMPVCRSNTNWAFLCKIALRQEVANTVIFLASDLASHITLQDMVVDGSATLAA